MSANPPCPSCGCVLYQEHGPCSGSTLSFPLAAALEAKDNAYRERNALVALLAAMYPSALVRHELREGEPWEDNWMNVVLIQLPTGQVSFHVHASELLTIFSHVPVATGEEWDGHTSEEKWSRVALLREDCRSLSRKAKP